MPASSKDFLDIKATIECGFTLKRVRDMTRTYSGGSYIEFHEWIKNEKAAINPINKKHDKCFQ